MKSTGAMCMGPRTPLRAANAPVKKRHPKEKNTYFWRLLFSSSEGARICIAVGWANLDKILK
jgi:hypothetical protein